MPKATLSALAWQQHWILWFFVYAVVLSVAYVNFGSLGVIWAWAALATFQIARNYQRMARLLRSLELRSLMNEPNTQGLWSALETLIIRRNKENRRRMSRLAQMLRGYRLAASAMPEGALVVKRNTGGIVWSNKTAKAMLNIALGDDVRLQEILTQPELKTWFDLHNFEQALLNIVAPNAAATNLDMFLLPYTSELSLIVLRDSTTMRKLEKIRSDFVANVSHELRTPLTVIHGYLELIEQQENPELQSIIIEMQKQSHRMNNLVEDLLNLSRLESEKELPDEIIQSSSLLSTLAQEANALNQNRHTIRIHNDFNGSIIGSPKDVHSAFSNLVSNAIRYTPTGGSIDIGMIYNAPGGVDFYVKDTGFGIPADHINRLTERFYRISASRSRELGGTGLGLSICKHVLNLHQAELLIESEPGKGSTFTCRFPKKRIAD
jgi:two-component system, OmpR family, phosphate regulon sensor histidine kinase PhoR